MQKRNKNKIHRLQIFNQLNLCDKFDFETSDSMLFAIIFAATSLQNINKTSLDKMNIYRVKI